AKGDEGRSGDAPHFLGTIAMEEGRFDEARTLIEQAKAIRKRFGLGISLQSSVHNLGLLAMAQGDYRRARPELESSLAMAKELGLEQQIANSLCDLGFAELGDERLDQ